MPPIEFLVNQYPAPTHTFIRREIHAVERLGIKVRRFSHRVQLRTGRKLSIGLSASIRRY